MKYHRISCLSVSLINLYFEYPGISHTAAQEKEYRCFFTAQSFDSLCFEIGEKHVFYLIKPSFSLIKLFLEPYM